MNIQWKLGAVIVALLGLACAVEGEDDLELRAAAAGGVVNPGFCGGIAGFAPGIYTRRL